MGGITSPALAAARPLLCRSAAMAVPFNVRAGADHTICAVDGKRSSKSNGTRSLALHHAPCGVGSWLGVVQMESRAGMAQLTWVSCGTPCSGSAKSGMSSRRPAMLLNCRWQAWGPNCREAAGEGFFGRGSAGGGGRQVLKPSCVSWLRGFAITYIAGVDAERAGRLKRLAKRAMVANESSGRLRLLVGLMRIVKEIR